MEEMHGFYKFMAALKDFRDYMNVSFLLRFALPHRLQSLPPHW